MDDRELKKLTSISDGKILCNIAISPANPLKLNLISDGVLWFGTFGSSETVIKSGNIKRVSKVNWGYIKKVTTVTG